jgi:ribosomal-protein-alanine N-acetyltransferase
LIETKRLIVRRFTPSDAEDLHAYLSDPVTYRFEPGKPLSLAETRDLAAERAKGNDFWAVVLKSENTLIGHLYFKQMEPGDQLTWELGYIFNPRYQKRGYASESAAALIQYAFAHCNIHRIMARCDPANPSSWKLLERIGFTREGHYRKAGCIHKDEKGDPIWNDVYEYSMLEDDNYCSSPSDEIT